ncbi:MAG: arginase family protein [Gaiellaceae bacterium]
MRISLITAPYNLGHEGVGVGAGPDRLLDEGAVDTLEGAGHEVTVTRVEPQAKETNEIGAAFEIVRRVSAAVTRAVENGAFPIVLSGNCFSSIGIVAGLDRDVGVVWLDAHPDFNTPDGSLSGFADGMGLSVLTGTSWKTLRETVPGYRTVPEASVVLVGIRDIDAGEKERLASSEIQVVEPAGAAEAIEAAVGRLKERVEDVYLHVDLDVLDPSEGFVNAYSAPDGLTADAVERVVGAATEGLAVRAAALTAYDPAVDADGRIPPIANRLLSRIAAAAPVTA